MTFQNAREFALYIKGLGFRVYIAKAGDYGFITDETESRVLSFGFSSGGSLSGNYGPPSVASGTGWRMERTPYDLRTAADVHEALYAAPPDWLRGKGWSYLSTVKQYLSQYGQSSGFVEVA